METAKSRTLSQGDLILYRKNQQPFILHPYNSVPAISSSSSLAPSLAPSSSISSSGLTSSSTSHSGAATATSIEATATDTPLFPVPVTPLDSSPPFSSEVDLLPVTTLTLPEELSCDDVNDVEKEMNTELNEDKMIDKEEMKEVEVEIEDMVNGGNQSDMRVDHEASTVVASIAIINNTMDVVDSHPTASTVYSSITDKVIPSNSDLIAEILPIKDTINSNNERDGRIATDNEQIGHIDKSNSAAKILDLDPGPDKIADVDPRSHTMTLENVNPHNTTESSHTDSFDNFDEKDIDSYFDCLTDSKSWDESDICALLNDSEIHEVVEELVLKVIEKVSNQDKEKLNSHSHMDVVSDSKVVIIDSKILEINNESCAPVNNELNTVKIERKDGYDNIDDHDNDKNNDKGVTISDSAHSDTYHDSNELALLRYQNDCIAGQNDVAHKDYYAWQTSRRWTAATIKVLLQALIEYVSFILPPSLSLASIASDD